MTANKHWSIQIRARPLPQQVTQYIEAYGSAIRDAQLDREQLDGAKLALSEFWGKLEESFASLDEVRH